MELGDKLSNETILVPMYAISKEEAIQELLTHLLSLDILSDTMSDCGNYFVPSIYGVACAIITCPFIYPLNFLWLVWGKYNY